jgi:hypothetical protein
VLACRVYTYQGLFNVLVSFVPPFGKIVGFLLTFPFGSFVLMAVVATHWGNAYAWLPYVVSVSYLVLCVF